MPRYTGASFARDMGDIFGPTVKYLKPVGDALMQKGISKIQSLKKGGAVKTHGKASAMVRLHKNEYVLPASVKPTKAQKAKVAKLHKK